MNIIQKVKTLKLSLGHYVVFGSGPLAVRGLRVSEDIDILVTADLYSKLKATGGWKEKVFASGKPYLIKDEFEVMAEWIFPGYTPDTAKLIREAEIIDGIPFAKLIEVRAWKQAFGRPKDLKDIQMIDLYLCQTKAK